MPLLSRHGAVTQPMRARLAPALLAFAATLLLGAVELRIAPNWRWAESPALLPAVGIVFASAAGLLACHLALSSVAPRQGWSASALPAALTAAALPGLGTAALFLPLMIATYAALCRSQLRMLALVGLGGIGIALVAAGLDSPVLHLIAALGLLAAAALHLGCAARPAVNDNARNPAFTAFWSLPEAPVRGTNPRTSNPVLGE